MKGIIGFGCTLFIKFINHFCIVHSIHIIIIVHHFCPHILPFTACLRLFGCLVGYLWLVINVGRKYLLSLSHVQRKVQSKCLPPAYRKPKVADVSLAQILVRWVMGYLYGHIGYLYGHIGYLYGHIGNLYADGCVLDMYTRHTRL